MGELLAREAEFPDLSQSTRKLLLGYRVGEPYVTCRSEPLSWDHYHTTFMQEHRTEFSRTLHVATP